MGSAGCGTSLVRMLWRISVGNGCSHAKVTAGVERGGLRATLLRRNTPRHEKGTTGLANVCVCGFAGVRPTDKDWPKCGHPTQQTRATETLCMALTGPGIEERAVLV